MIKKYFVLLCLMFPSFGNAQVLNLEQYMAFLQKAQTEEISAKNMDDFYKTSRAFWMANKVDYNDHPAKYEKAMDLYHDGQDRFVRDRSIKIDRFESTIENFRRFDVRNTLPENPILFVGSSSIVFWQTANSFPEYPVTNRGFGGASLPEVIHYYDDVIKKHNPSMMVVYCDIDVENGKSPEFSVNAFKELVSRVEQDFKNIPILMLSMKPTLVDDLLGREIRKNKMITNQKLMEFSNSQDNLYYVDITSPMMRADGSLKPEIFLDDGMHLNSKGYDLWDPILRKEIKQIRGN
ncbi:MAG: hypothetical protein KDF58_04775 [Alphaproteobacteria bacterium]|nr:hypothetical protein [Alphaproteobacteria bacterium]HPF45715.1 hypothetical protein [Emcibacteraceae bacterium]